MGEICSKRANSPAETLPGVTQEQASPKYLKASAVARLGEVSWYARYHLEPRRFEDDYTMCSDILGTGCNGAVRVATSRINSHQRVAVKTFFLKKMGKRAKACLKDEIENYLSMDHPHIARLLDVYESRDHVHLVMECLEGGELFDRIKDHSQKFSEREASQALRQMLLALNYMHSNGYVHRDVKLENFVYDSKNGDHLKLIDFGFSAKLDPKSNEKLHESLGTPGYCAPEVYHGSYTSQCDMWSLGSVAYILLSGQMPFEGDSDQIEWQVCKGKYSMDSSVWRGISDEAKAFVRSFLTMDASQRLSAQEALNHPWINHHMVTNESTSSVAKTLRDYGRASNSWRYCMQSLAWSLSNEYEAKIRDYFLAMSPNQQGFLKFGELRSVIFSQFPDMAVGEFEEICHALDHNNDRTIHYSDFLAAMLGSWLPLSRDLIATLSQRLGIDTSGEIATDDLHKATVNLGENIIQKINPCNKTTCVDKSSSSSEKHVTTAMNSSVKWSRLLQVIPQFA